ncbi:unnamed protein product [Moneuplotes crassus]|uniref:Uncharacterized protein n=1 Tax=Euplotes crassus TaxID=5936 RepID=A0AAD1Y029_EUPCR|nr:unnamed protein product [Moneuplotes crassus]
MQPRRAYSIYETPQTNITRKSSCNRKNQSSGMSSIFGGGETYQDTSQRNARISSTAGSNIVHSPQYQGQSFTSPGEDSSAFSNPLDVLESFKKTALDELMHKHNSEYNQNNEQPSENTYDRPYTSEALKNARPDLSDQRKGHHSPVRPTQEFPNQDEQPHFEVPAEVRNNPMTEVEESKAELSNKAQMRTTKPPTNKKKKNPWDNPPDDTSVISKENYHYAKEKLRKDQERLKKSTYKQKQKNKDEKPQKRGRQWSKPPPVGQEKPGKHSFLKRKEPSYRPPSGVKRNLKRNVDKSPRKQEPYQRRTGLNFSHGNMKQKNQDLEDIMSIADQTAEKFAKQSNKKAGHNKGNEEEKNPRTKNPPRRNITEDHSYLTQNDLSEIKRKLKEPIPDLDVSEPQDLPEAPENPPEEVYSPSKPDRSATERVSPPPLERASPPKMMKSPAKIDHEPRDVPDHEELIQDYANDSVQQVKKNPPQKPKPQRMKRRPGASQINQDAVVVYKNCDLQSVISNLRQETVSKNKKAEVDQRRYIILKSQLDSIITKNNALLETNKRQRKCMLEALQCMNDTENYLKQQELVNAQNPENSDAQSSDIKYSKNVKSCKKRLENILKEERRNYTLSHFTHNPLYPLDYVEDPYSSIEEEEKEIDIKIDRNMLFNIEQKLSNILKRSLEMYKSNIIDKKPFEKVKVLKFSEGLRDCINDLITTGVGIRDRDCRESGASPFQQWDDYVESNLTFKIDPTHLKRDEKSEYLNDDLIETLWDIAQWSNTKKKEKKQEFYDIVDQIRKTERADKTKIKICENQIRLLRGCFSELYDEIEVLKRRAKSDINKIVNKVEHKLDENFIDLENTLEKCRINEANDVDADYTELYAIFNHLQPQIREALDCILENKDEDYQNVFGINSKIKELLTQDYFIE